MPKPKTKPDLSDELRRAEAALAAAREEASRLETLLKTARSEAPAAPVTLHMKIEQHLAREVMSTTELAAATGASKEEVLKVLKADERAVDLSALPDRQRWTLRVSPSASPAELRAAVVRLICDQPLSFRDLCAATGRRDQLVQGALVDARRDHPSTVNVGTKDKGYWYIVPVDAIPGALARR